MQMFLNIEGKIKFAAKLLIIIGAFGSFGLFVVLLVTVGAVMGIIALVCGVALTWIISCIVYGFGELIENTRACAKMSGSCPAQNYLSEKAGSSRSEKP